MLLSMLSSIYGLLSSLKNFLYDADLIDSLKLSKPVVSVGNLTLGGTGKTPFIQMLIEHLQKKGLGVAVVGRSYKGSNKETTLVKPWLQNAAQNFGDEPTLLAKNNPKATVFVGPQKWRSAYAASMKSEVDILLVDDGFQHRALHRDLDFVLLDATARLEDYRQIPEGRARESWKSLERADFLVLTKVNLAEEAHINRIKEYLPVGKPIIEVAYRLEFPIEDTGTKVLSLAGIGRPESFHQSVKQDTLYEIVGTLDFPDHYQFTLKDLKEIKHKQTSLFAQLVLMTEKDFVKIEPLLEQDSALRPEDIRVLPLKTYFLDSSASFDAALDRLVSPT
jgi:tetraacyldisaccharide 4'-kinase